MKEEKAVSPLFPRLHVKDSDKGGPRPPPRNKMALYEQLSVPTTRPNSGSAPTLSIPFKASSSQGGGFDGSVFSQFYFPSPMDAHLTEKVQSCSPNTAMGHFEQNLKRDADFPRVNAVEHLSSTAKCSSFQPHYFSQLKNSGGKILGDKEVGLPVPACTNSRITPCSSIHPGGSTVLPRNGMPKSAATICSSSTRLYNASDLHLKRSNSKKLTPGQHVKDQNTDTLEVSTKMNCTEKSASHLLPSEKTDEHLKHAVASLGQGYRCSPVDNVGSARDVGAQLHQEYRFGLGQENTACSNQVSIESKKLEKSNVSSVRMESCSNSSLQNDHKNSNEADSGNGYCKDKACRPLKAVDVEKNDDISEASMVDSISGMEITADDVVDMIGQQHFWKARRLIVTQQRAFAGQVFELHRLIEVQKLIAGSPNLLLEDNPEVYKSSTKASFAKKLPTERVLKPQTMNHKNDFQKQNQSPECADENNKELAQHSSCLTQQSSCGSYSGNAPLAPVASDNKTGPWSFHPPLGNQWLVPVMSPSEGLIYKPYPGPFPPNTGVMAPIYGGCSPISIPPMEGRFLNQNYGAPATHPQGIGVHSITHPATHTFSPSTYFPPYCMPVLNTVNSSTGFNMAALPGAQIRGQAEQLSHSQSRQNEAASSHVGKFHASKDTEIQGSTASNHFVRLQGDGAGQVSEQRNTVLPLFPMDLVRKKPAQTHDQTASVIRVVPHNPISATESAARIFHSIQKERQQYDTV